MTSADSDVRTELLRLTATFDDVDRLDLVELSEDVFNLSGLLYVGYLMAQGDLVVSHAPKPPEVIAKAVRLAREALEDTRIERVSYNSPLEISVWVSSIAGSVILTARALSYVLSKAQEARRDKAATDAFVMAQEGVKNALSRHIDAGLNVEELPTKSFIDGAARAMLNIDEVRFEDLT